MRIKVTISMNETGIDCKKVVVLENEDYGKLLDCLDFVKELYNAVVREGATIPPTATQLWRLLNQIEVINEEHSFLLSQAEK